MDTIVKLNSQIDTLLSDYDNLKLENQTLKYDLSAMIDKNDELVRSNQDMLLKIDSTLTFVKSKDDV